jgi:2,3-bisphosphoglycerate-independent phosphoglycerate mutase
MIEDFYKSGIYDENIPPFVMDWYDGFSYSDTVWMLNFRYDRIKQILSVFQKDGIEVLKMMDLFEYPVVNNTLGEVVSKHGLKQLRIAETEKYAHVTYFVNGGREEMFPHEDRVLIPSPNVQDYAITPDMSSYEITKRLLEEIKGKMYDLIIVNYASPDMIGHTGILKIAQMAIMSLDDHITQVVKMAKQEGYDILITSDHGNVERMVNDDGSPCKTHTDSVVPFSYISNNDKVLINNGALHDVAPTILRLFGLEKPDSMSGSSLITYL